MTLTPSASPAWELLDLDQTEQEYVLFDSVVCEKTDISGFPILYYVKVDLDESDYLYGEDQNEKFTEGYYTKFTYEPSEEVEILSAFGITSDDTLQYAQFPKTIFWRDVERNYLQEYIEETEIVPKVGDVVNTLWNNKLYQIVEVGSEQNIFQGKKLIWELILRPYKHSEESDSAEDMLFYEPSDKEFPDINKTTSTENLSAYGDNDNIDDESYDDPDSSIFGY